MAGWYQTGVRSICGLPRRSRYESVIESWAVYSLPSPRQELLLCVNSKWLSLETTVGDSMQEGRRATELYLFGAGDEGPEVLFLSQFLAPIFLFVLHLLGRFDLLSEMFKLLLVPWCHSDVSYRLG